MSEELRAKFESSFRGPECSDEEAARMFEKDCSGNYVFSIVVVAWKWFEIGALACSDEFELVEEE